MIKWLVNHEIWLLTIAGPLMLFPGLFGSSGTAPWLGLAVIGLAWIARWISTGRPTRFTPLDIPLIGLVILTWLGTRISIAPELSWNRAWSLVFGLAVYYTIVNWVNSASRQRAAVWILTAITIGVLLLGLVGTDWSKVRLLNLPGLYEHLPGLNLSLSGSGVNPANELFNPRAVGITLGMLLPVFWGLLFFSADRRLKIIAGLIAVIGSCVLLISQTVQGLAGMGAGLLFLFIWRTRPGWRWIWLTGLAASAAGVAILIAALGPIRIAQYLLSTDNPVGLAIALRLDIWSRALAMLHDMPYTGVGLNAFQSVQANFYPGFSIGLEPHAHNLYLQTALDFGLPGLYLFIWMAIAWFWAVGQNHKTATEPVDRLLLACMTAALIAYLTHGFMDALVLGAKSVSALWLVLGLGIATPVFTPEMDGARQSRSWLKYLPVVLLGVLIAVSLVLRPAYFYMNTGALAAQKILTDLENTRAQEVPISERHQIMQAQLSLQHAISLDPQRTVAYDLLARLGGWQGQTEQSLQSETARVDLDARLPEPYCVYYPPDCLLRRLADSPAPVDRVEQLQMIYQNWLTRYPQHAEHALRMSLFLAQVKNQPEAALQILAQAQLVGAQPAMLLNFDQQELSGKQVGLPR